MQLRVSSQYAAEGIELSPAQVKISSGKPEVDFYVPPAQWEMLDKNQQKNIISALKHIFGVDEADAYQILSNIDDWVDPSRGGSARWSPRNPPPGAVVFPAHGDITHPEIGGH